MVGSEACSSWELITIVSEFEAAAGTGLCEVELQLINNIVELGASKTNNKVDHQTHLLTYTRLLTDPYTHFRWYQVSHLPSQNNASSPGSFPSFTLYRIAGMFGGDKVWRIASSKVVGEKKFGECLQQRCVAYEMD